MSSALEDRPCTCAGAAADYHNRCATCRGWVDRYCDNIKNLRALGMSRRQLRRPSARIERIERRLRVLEGALVANGIE